MDLGSVHHTIRLQRIAHHIPALRTEQRGLPLSIQFVGRHLAEPLLVQVGHAYEAATQHQLRPDV